MEKIKSKYPSGLPPINIDPISLNLRKIFSKNNDEYPKIEQRLKEIEDNLEDLYKSSLFLSSHTLISNIEDILNKLSEPNFTDKFVNEKMEKKLEKDKKKMKQQLIELYLFQINKVLQILINITNIKKDTSSDLDDKVFNSYLLITSSLISIVKMNLDIDGYDVSDSEDNWGILKKS